MQTNNDEFVAAAFIVPGPQGEAGQDGEKGEDGVDGKDGRDGKDGKDGIVENLTFANILGNPADSEALAAYIETKITSMVINGNNFEF